MQKKEITFYNEIIPVTSLHKENLTNTQPYLIIKLIILLKNISRRNTWTVVSASFKKIAFYSNIY